MNIEMWPVDRPKPYPGNPRVNAGAVDAVAESIKRFGFRVPVVVDSADVIIAGHTRMLAAAKLGLKEVPVHVAADLSPDQAKALRLADNKSGEIATWDDSLLARELGELFERGIDMGDIGFTEAELEAARVKAAQYDCESGEMPALREGDKEAFSHPTFTLSDAQALVVDQAIEKAKESGPFVDTGNGNSNGNALARIAEAYLAER